MRWTYEKGLQDLGNGAYAWLAPDGSWGWSNAGLIVDGEKSLLVDTLFDLRLTREMLDAMRDAEPRATSRIGTLVNTHANGDHCHGNQLVEGAEIIASAAAAEEMAALPPEAMAGLMKAMAEDASPLGQFFRRWLRHGHPLSPRNAPSDRRPVSSSALGHAYPGMAARTIR